MQNTVRISHPCRWAVPSDNLLKGAGLPLVLPMVFCHGNENPGEQVSGQANERNQPSNLTSCFSRLLCTTALVASSLFVGVLGSSLANAGPTTPVSAICETGTGAIWFVQDELNPEGVELDVDIEGCHEPTSGQGYLSGLWTGDDWSANENALTINGTIDVRANAPDGQAIDGDAETRAIHAERWSGITNTLINHAEVTAASHAGVGPGGGTAKSFGIYTGNWDGQSNSLFNYGNINSTVTGGSGVNANEAHGIRMGQWNGAENYFENWGNITLSGSAIGNGTGNADSVNGFISTQGMNGAENVLKNYGNLYGTAFGGHDAGGSAVAVMRGINLANFDSSGASTLVENWGDIDIWAQGGDNAGGDSYATAAGIQFRSVSDTTEEFAFVNYGNMDLTSISGLNGGGFGDAWAFGMRTNALNATEYAVLANIGQMNVLAQSDYAAGPTRAYGLTFGNANENAIIYNAGIIDVSVDAPNGRAVGMGTWGGGGAFNGHMRNDGKIVARAMGGADGEGYVVYLGAVSAEQVVDEFGVENLPSVELSTQGFLEGRIRVGGQTLFVDNELSSASVHWTAEDTTGLPTWGSFEGQGVVFYSEDGLSAATFDNSLLAAQNTIVAHIAGIGVATEAAQLTAALMGATGAAYPLAADKETAPSRQAKLRFWGGGYYGELELDGSERGINDSSTKYSGTVVGLVTGLNEMELPMKTALGLSFGALTGDSEAEGTRWMGRPESEFNSYFLGASVAASKGPLQTRLGLRVGMTEYDHERNVNNNLVYGGIETAEGNQDVRWLLLSGGIAYNLDTINNIMFTPFANVSHFMARQEGYSESGIDSAATVEDRDTTMTRVEIGLRGAMPIGGTGLSATGTVKAFSNFESGDSSVSMSILDDTNDDTLTQTDTRGVSVGMGLSHQFSELASFSSGIELVKTNVGDTSYTGRVLLSIKF